MHKNNICYQQNVLLSLSHFLQESCHLEITFRYKKEDIRREHHLDIKDIAYADKRDFYL